MLWNFSVASAAGLVARTWPFLLLRTIVYGLAALVFLLMVGSGAIIGHQITPAISNDTSALQGAVFGMMGGGAFGMLVLRILREYTLYMVKAAHIAVIVQLMDHGALPAGQTQLSFGWRAVQARFGTATLLFALDQAIKAVLASLQKLLSRFGMLVPGLALVTGAVQAVAEVAIGYVDEIIVAENFRKPGRDPWRVSADAVVLYAQNGKLMVKNAAWLALFMLIAGALIFVALVGPFMATFSVSSGATMGYSIIAAIVFALFVIHTLLEPFAVCALLQVYTQATGGQQPDPAWDKRLREHAPDYALLRDGGPDGDTSAPIPA